MPKYIISAEEPGGSKITEEFEATSAGEAVRDLRARGYTNVKLETEEINAIVNQQFEELTNVHPVDRFVTPKDYVTFSKSPWWRKFFFRRAKDHSKKQMSAVSWAFYLSVGIAIAIYWEVRSRVRGAMIGVDVMVFAIVGIIILWPVLHVLFFGASRRFNQLIEALSWSRWDEALQIVPTLKGHIAAFDMAVYRAQALSGLGKQDQALGLVAPFADGTTVPEWYYWTRVVSLYYAAGQPEKILECHRKALELEPNQATSLIDYATVLVRFKKDLVQGRALLDQINPDEVTDLMQGFIEAAKGQIALEEKQFKQAREHFQVSMRLRSQIHNGYGRQGMDILHGYLALVHAGLGEMDEARRHFKVAEPRLKSLPIQDILERCRHTLGAYAN